MKKLYLRLLGFLALVLLASCATPYKNYPKLKTFDELVYPFEMKKQQLSQNVVMAYADVGSGPQTLIFVHGLGSYAPAWKKNVEDLKDQYRCLVVDLPGYGKSSKGAYESSMEFYANYLVEWMDSIGLSSAIVVGHSMGGQIAMVMALTHPQRVNALVLAAPAGFETFDEGQKQWFREVLSPKSVALTPASGIQSNLTYNFNVFPEDANFMISDRLAMRHMESFDAYCYVVVNCVKGMVNRPVYDYLHQIKQPTLVVFGEYDMLIPNRWLNPGFTQTIAKDGVSKIPNARLLMLPKAGHFVQWEAANLVNREIKLFVDNLQ